MPFDSSLRARFLALPLPIMAAVAMIVASLFFAGLSALVRVLGETLHPFEVAFFRNLAGLAFMMPWLLRHGFTGMRTNRLWLYGWRSGLSLISMLCNFTSLVLLPFEQAVALSFTTPLFATIGARLILGEQVRVRRWTATLAGFFGVLVMLRPGLNHSLGFALSGAGLGALLGVAAAMISAVVTLIVKDLSRTEPSDAIVTYMVLLLTPMSLIPALPFWQWPPLFTWPVIVGMGACGSFGHMCYIRAFAMAMPPPSCPTITPASSLPPPSAISPSPRCRTCGLGPAPSSSPPPPSTSPTAKLWQSGRHNPSTPERKF